MRSWMVATIGAALASSAEAQRGPVSSVTQIALTARKLGTIGVMPIGAEAQQVGLAPAVDSTSSSAVIAQWNLPLAQIGDVRLRTARQTGRLDAPYIERRVLLHDPIARSAHPLDLAADAPLPAHAVVVVRLVVY